MSKATVLLQYPILVDYERPVEALLPEFNLNGVSFGGGEDYPPPHDSKFIRKARPQGKGQIEEEISVVQFDTVQDRLGTIMALRGLGLVPITLWELLCFAKRFSGNDLRMGIIALGTEVRRGMFGGTANPCFISSYQEDVIKLVVPRYYAANVVWEYPADYAEFGYWYPIAAHHNEVTCFATRPL